MTRLNGLMNSWMTDWMVWVNHWMRTSMNTHMNYSLHCNEPNNTTWHYTPTMKYGVDHEMIDLTWLSFKFNKCVEWASVFFMGKCMYEYMNKVHNNCINEFDNS